MEYNNDLLTFMRDNLCDMAESHLESWAERYYRKSAEMVESDLNINYDFSADIECVEN